MTATHHPDISTLMSYSAGSLGEALSAVVACHLDMCGVCRREVLRLNRVGGALIDAASGDQMSAASIAAVMARLDAVPASGPTPPRGAPTAVGDVPLPLRKLIGDSFDAAPWRRIGPGIRHIRLPLSPSVKGDLRLLRVAPGRKVPDHGHGGAELTLVLKGAYDDVVGHFSRGDVADLDVDIEHQPVASPGEECICLVAAEHKAKFKSIIGRIIQPLVGM